jgi:sortase A
MPAGPEGWIRIPAIRLYAPLAGDLETGACAFDGLGGSRVIVAHRDRHFRPLSRVAAGQTVCVDSADGSTETFRVVECEVLEPDAVARRILDKRGERWLVLMTCHPFSVLGPAPGRFLVWAAPVAAGR